MCKATETMCRSSTPSRRRERGRARSALLVAVALAAAAALIAVLVSPSPPPAEEGPATARRTPAPEVDEPAAPTGLGPGAPLPPEATPEPAGEPEAPEEAPPAVPAPGGPPVVVPPPAPPVALPGIRTEGPRLPEPTASPPERTVEDLVEGGLTSVEGTIVLKTKGPAKVEPGVPVALSGRVVEKESSQPVAGATVLLHSAFYVRALFYDHHLREVARVRTDPDGRFLVERLDVDPVHFGKGGRVYLSVRSADHAPLLSIPLDGVRAGYRNRLPDLVLSRERHVVRGRVLDRWEGEPVAGGRVVATGEIHPIHYPKDQREALFLSSPHATTDEEGRFVLENVGPGTQMISVHGGDDCAGYLQVKVPLKGEVVIRARQIRGRIEGKVIDEFDRPIPLVRIDGGENTTHTFADGTFVLENFRGDLVDLSLTHADYRPATSRQVPDGSRGLTVRMASRWPLVRFRVTAHGDGAPVPIVSVKLEFPGQPVPVPASPFFLSAAGVHAVRVPDGATTATIEAEGREAAEVDLTGVRDGDTVDVILR
jgi:hypothetical protein